MKQYFILLVLVITTHFAKAQACFQENFDVQTVGWAFSQGAGEGTYDNPLKNGCGNNDDDRGIITPGVGGNNPANILTPDIVSSGGNTIQFSFDFFVFNSNLKCDSWKNFDCPTSIDVFYYVGGTKYDAIIDLILPPNGSLNPCTINVNFAVDSAILPSGTNYKIELAFKPKSGVGNCIQENTKYVIDNFKVCEKNCVTGGEPSCSIDGKDDDFCLQIPIDNKISGDLSLNDSKYIGAILTYSLAAGPYANGNVNPGGAILVINPDGTFTLTRTDLTKTMFNFTYQVCDQNNQCDLVSAQACFPIDRPLAITISSFSASRKGSAVQLNWNTSFEMDAKNFEIERQADGQNGFAKIGDIQTTNNSNGSSYSFSDNNPSKSTSLYRLKLVDADNTFKYSEVRSVRGLSSTNNFTIFPNPSTNGTVKIIASSASESFDVQLIDNLGKVLKTTSLNNNNPILFTNLKRGLYLIRMSNKSNGNSTTEKLIVN
jgi:hypothetical protein